MAHDANADERQLAELATHLADLLDAALPGWVEAAVARVARAYRGDVGVELSAAAHQAGVDARTYVGPHVRALLARDVDDQHQNPLAVIRTAVRYPTEVLRAAGVPPVVRDDMAVRQFPDDDYDLVPTSFADFGSEVGEAGVAWGAAKAFVVLARRRAEGRA